MALPTVFVSILPPGVGGGADSEDSYYGGRSSLDHTMVGERKGVWEGTRGGGREGGKGRESRLIAKIPFIRFFSSSMNLSLTN